MIHYLVTMPHRYTIGHFLRGWGRALAPRFRVLCWEQLPSPAELADGTYIFSDLERLTRARLEGAAELWDALEARGPDRVRLLNRPHTFQSRFQLLRTLHEAGRNDFNVHRLDDPWEKIRYPVFVRHAFEHSGSFSGLLRDADALRKCVDGLLAGGSPPGDLLIAEFCDVSDAAGWFRKYAAMRVADCIVARHLKISRRWLIKGRGRLAPGSMLEEIRFLRQNPHQPALRELFALAGIDFGRADYGICAGRIQLWEINSNPSIMQLPSAYRWRQRPVLWWWARRFCAVLAQLDRAGPPAAHLAAAPPVAGGGPRSARGLRTDQVATR